MYTRPPHRMREKLSIPENYSGNAFRPEGSLSTMPPPVRTRPPQSPTKHDNLRESAPHLPTYAPLDLPEEEQELHFLPLPDAQRDREEEEGADQDAQPPPLSAPLISNATQESHSSALAATAGHFPFGHGLGSEELLIMAMMLMIFLSEKDDTDLELLALLGLLLFAG